MVGVEEIGVGFKGVTVVPGVKGVGSTVSLSVTIIREIASVNFTRPTGVTGVTGVKGITVVKGVPGVDGVGKAAAKSSELQIFEEDFCVEFFRGNILAVGLSDSSALSEGYGFKG